MDPVFIDTSAYYALFDKTDKNHLKAKAFLETNISPLLTTNLVVIEIINLVPLYCFRYAKNCEG